MKCWIARHLRRIADQLDPPLPQQSGSKEGEKLHFKEDDHQMLAPHEIKAALVLRGIRQKAIARRLSVTPQTVNAVVAGRKRSARVQREIARALGRRGGQGRMTEVNHSHLHCCLGIT